MLKLYSRKKNVCKIFYAVKHNICSVSTSVFAMLFCQYQKIQDRDKNLWMCRPTFLIEYCGFRF